MFYALEGLVIEKKSGFLVIKIGGIYFTVYTTLITYLSAEINQNIKLFVEFVVGENSFRLYGFLHEEEKILFNELRKIPKIAAKIAISILSKFSTEEFKAIISNNDINKLTTVPGVGQKTASAIVFELSGKMLVHDEKLVECLNVLTNSLGFNRQQVYPILEKVYNANRNFDSTQLIKEVLKQLRP